MLIKELDLYSASLMKQQSTGKHVAPFEHIILIPSQAVFALFIMNYFLPLFSPPKICFVLSKIILYR